MKFIQEYRVNANDVDCNNIVSASNMLRYMQDCAFSAMEADGPSYMDLFERGYAFLLSRLRASFYAPIYSHDKLSVETWACESKGVQFNRCYRVLRDDAIVAEAVSVWALCGVEDRRVHRVSEIGSPYRVDEMLELDLPARLKIPEEAGLRLVGEKTVEYADIDLNGHMNNTRYPDILCGFIDENMKGRRVISLGLSLVGEAPLGETLRVYASLFDGVNYVRTLKENGSVNVEAEILTDEI